MKDKFKSRLFFIVFGASILINVVFLKYDVFDYFQKGKIETFTAYVNNEAGLSDYSRLEHTIVDRGLQMAASDKVEMIWKESSGLTGALLGHFSNRNDDEFKIYNFPRAYLFYALAEYYKGLDRLTEVKALFDKIIDVNGQPIFKLDKIDQIPFGLTSLILYDKYKESKYLNFSDKLYQFLLENRNSDGIITYRKGQKILYVDVLGMITPFLISYGNITGNSQAIEFAKQELSFFIANGVDNQDYLPVHGFELKSKNDIGSTNWGRGIGWYYIALANMYKHDKSFERELQGIHNSLQQIQNSDKLWSQFPGSSDVFDASATTMILYSEGVNSSIVNEKKKMVLSHLIKYIDDKGAIMQSSGDTYSANNYSKSFGKSELSQAFLILYLANK